MVRSLRKLQRDFKFLPQVCSSSVILNLFWLVQAGYGRVVVMGPGQNFLTRVGSGQFFVARVGSGQPFMVWV